MRDLPLAGGRVDVGGADEPLLHIMIKGFISKHLVMVLIPNSNISCTDGEASELSVYEI